MKTKFFLISLSVLTLFVVVSLGVVYHIKKKNQLVNIPQDVQTSTSTPVETLTREEKKELGKARAIELLQAMNDNNNASSTSLSKEQQAAKAKEAEKRAAELLNMMK